MGCLWVYVGRQGDKRGEVNWLRDGSYTDFGFVCHTFPPS